MKKNRLLPLLLALSLFLILPGCQKELTEEERLALIAEMGEKGREYHEKRQRFLDSDLYAEGYAYLESLLKELVPGGEYVITIEPGDWIDATDEELAGSLGTEEERIEFFYRADAYFSVNFWDFDLDGNELANELMNRQISGKMNNDEYNSAEWILNAKDGKVEFYVYPGV